MSYVNDRPSLARAGTNRRTQPHQSYAANQPTHLRLSLVLYPHPVPENPMPDTQPNPAEPASSAPEPPPPDSPPGETPAIMPAPPNPPELIPEPTPMLDVHPAHHAAQTWRDFFIHIATIVLGLIIAVGLEQTVEYLHHLREAREARENINQEVATNLDILQDNQKDLAKTQQQLAKNLDLLNSGASDAQILPQLDYRYDLHRSHDAAWVAAKIDGSLALIPSSQIGHANYFYESTEALEPARFSFFTDMDTAEALLDHAKAVGKLAASDRQQLLALTASAMGRDLLISRFSSIQIKALQSNNLQ